MIYPALVSITFRQLTVEEIIALCVENGIKAVEWGSDVHVPEGDIETAKYVKKLSDENGIKTASYASYYILGKNEDYKTEFAKHIACAKELGTKTIRLWAMREASQDVCQERLVKIYEEANAIADMAEKDGITISYEFHHVTLTDTLESTLKLLENAPKTCSHWQRPIGMCEEECFEQIKALKDKIRNLHVNNRQDDGQYHALENIRGQWLRYLTELSTRDGEDIYACVEFVRDKKVEQFIDDAKTLNSILSEIYAK
ncbi:MAG: TIM barrel protein [Clostridia bacterium]